MPSYIALGVSCLIFVYVVQTYRAFARNLAAAKQSGIPYLCTSRLAVMLPLRPPR